MDRNQDFTFYEGADSDGRYWTPLNEAVGHYGHGHDDFEDDYEGDDDQAHDFMSGSLTQAVSRWR